MSESQLYLKKFKKKILRECIIHDKVIVQCLGFCEELLATKWNGKRGIVALKEISPWWYWEAATQSQMNALTEEESCPDVIHLSRRDIKLFKKTQNRMQSSHILSPPRYGAEQKEKNAQKYNLHFDYWSYNNTQNDCELDFNWNHLRFKVRLIQFLEFGAQLHSSSIVLHDNIFSTDWSIIAYRKKVHSYFYWYCTFLR